MAPKPAKKPDKADKPAKPKAAKPKSAKPAKKPAKPKSVKSPDVPAPEASSWKRALEAGMQFTEMGRSQARDVARDLVSQGVLARDQVSAAVDDIVDLSRRRADALRGLVRQEVNRQMGALGLATKDDLAALERRLGRRSPAAPEKSAPEKSAPEKKPAVKKPAGSATRKAG